MDNTTLKVRYVWWYRYRIPSLPIMLLLVAGCLYFVNISWTQFYENTRIHATGDSVISVKIHHYLFLSLLALFTYFLIKRIYSFIIRQRYFWNIEPDGVLINHGYLIKDSVYYISSDKIYEAYYYRGVIGKLLNFGHVEIKKNDGLATTYKGGPFANVNKIAQAINQIVTEKNDDKRVVQTVAQNETRPPGKADELEKLIELRNQGKISEQEYEELKLRLFA